MEGLLPHLCSSKEEYEWIVWALKQKSNNPKLASLVHEFLVAKCKLIQKRLQHVLDNASTTTIQQQEGIYQDLQQPALLFHLQQMHYKLFQK